MQYDAAAVGNHEFNYGLPTLDRAVRAGAVSVSRRERLHARRHTALSAVGLSTRRGIKIAIVGATTPGSMVWDRDNLAGRLDDRRHRPRGARRRARSARRRRDGRDRRRALRTQRAVELRHREHRRAERERRGARRARGAGHRSHRLRPLAQGDGRHRHRQDAAHAAEELGDERRDRASRAASGATAAGMSWRSEVRSCRRRITGRTRRCSR